MSKNRPKYFNEEKKNEGDSESSRRIIVKGIVDNFNYVNVRMAPSSLSKCVTILERGDEVIIQKKVRDYYKIMTANGSIEGFIPCQYCREV